MNSAQHPLGDPAELAALYAAGAMTAQEADAFEAHLAGGCAPCLAEVRALDATVLHLAEGAGTSTPPAHVREALLERVAARPEPPRPDAAQVWRRWTDEPEAAGLFTRRAGEGPWEETGVAGVRVRRLFVDRSRNEMTMLVRMEAGSAYPRHVHDGPEQCLVLEGDLHVGDLVLQPGDYQRAAPGSLHGVQSTEGGCLLLIMSSLSDEMV
jgi:anti-sigma factor ChrR (cupin superfamily)